MMIARTLLKITKDIQLIKNIKNNQLLAIKLFKIFKGRSIPFLYYIFPRNGLKLFHSYFLSDSTETKLIYLYFMGEPIKGLPKWSVSGSICMLNMCLNDFTLPNLSMTQCFILMLMIL